MSELRTNCPRDCYDNCGIVARPAADGRVILRGDPDHPVNRGSLCAKCATAYNGVWQDPEARLSTPLRRVGPKGQGAFEPVTWEAALAEIAERTQGVIEERGPAAVLHTHYSGTLSMLAFTFPMRFFNRLGATEVEPDSICNLAGHVAWSSMFGISVAGFDPRTAVDSSCIMVWGANPSHSAPHMDEHWLGDFNGSVVVVDPIRTDTAAEADLHLQPFPGSDAALAFAIANELHEIGAFDAEFIAAHVDGADHVLPSIEACTPEWGEDQTGVPASQIRQAAELYAAGPALLWAGQGLQRQPTGANVMRAVGLLPALTGNIGKPGAGICYLNVAAALLGADFDELGGASLAAGDGPKINHIGLAAQLDDPDRFGALYCWNTNPLASAADQSRLRRALGREDLFTVVVDCFATDTVDHADIVLPAASFLEFDDLTFNYMTPIIGAQRKVREPIGDALPNQEIFRRLAAAMGYDEPALYETDDALIQRLLDQMSTGLTFVELAERGHIYLTDEPYDFFSERRFPTPSGRIEIASDAAVEAGLTHLPTPSADPPPAEGRFRLLSPASRWRLNDSHANDRIIARRSGPAAVTLHPADANELGVVAGDRVRLSNDAGQLELEAAIDEITPRGVLVSHKGRWPKMEPGGANINVLHRAQSSDIEGCTAVHGTYVNVEPVPRVNELGQPIGRPVDISTALAVPPRTTMHGQYCNVVPLDASRHGSELFAAYGEASDDGDWTYLPYGPFPDFDDFIAWLTDAARQSDPAFYAIVASPTGKAVGIASFLRIDPPSASIEVGHIHLAPSLQQTAAATEAMYLMMKRVFDHGYRRYEWKCDDLNAPSRSAARRLGFAYEGTFRQATHYKGRNRDTAWFSILDIEWPKLAEEFERWLQPSNFDGEGRQRSRLRANNER